MSDLDKVQKDSVSLSKSRGFLIAIGFMLVFDGIFFGLENLGIFGLELKKLWPIVVINAGFAFLVSDLFVFHKVRSVVLFPSCALCALGIVFLLFSNGVFHIHFRKFIALFWPVILVVLGVLLIFIYGAQRIGKGGFPYIKDDTSEDGF